MMRKSAGDCYVDIETMDIRLISEKITNKPYKPIVKSEQKTYVDNVESITSTKYRSDSISFSSITAVSNSSAKTTLNEKLIIIANN